ncbi:MAG: Zn-ribbon domain-containing OB-fold protein [Dehalococcoidia bacterium]|nr:Zn-ribbon domain-containing OB-fold protein [Dehalococcoidia bacterium]
MSSKKKVAIIEGLFTWPSDDPRLIISRCKKCGSASFPKAPFCPNPDCEKSRDNIEVVELSKRGKLYSYTYQIYQPPAPFRMEPFEPYAIGMVDFPEGLRIYGIINRMENLRIGMEVETTVDKLYEDEENEYITWMWKPID